MKPILIKLVVKELRETADKLEAGTSFLSEEECTDILETLTHTALSKDEACSYLRISRATFDNRVAAGEYPKGRKLRGRKELIWFKDEIVNCKNVLKQINPDFAKREEQDEKINKLSKEINDIKEGFGGMQSDIKQLLTLVGKSGNS